MRLRSAFYAVVVLTLLGAALVIRGLFLIPSQADIAHLVSSSWNATTHDTLTFQSDTSFSLFPHPQFTLHSPEIRTESGLSVKADRITFGSPILSLITGDYKIASMRIEGGEAQIPDPLNAHSRSDTEILVKSFVSYFDEIAARPNKNGIDTVELINITLKFAQPHPLSPLLIQDAKLHVNAAGAFSLDARAVSHEVPFAFEFNLDASDKQASHERPARFLYRDADLHVGGRGIIATYPDVQFIGPVTFQSDTLDHVFSRVFDQRVPVIPAASTIEADARASFSAITLAQMQWKIGKSKLNGNMLIDFNRSVPRITGTFAANEMDLSEFAEQIGIKRDALGNWSQDKFKEQIIPDIDLDLRLSSDLVTVHDLTVKSVAVSALLQDKRLELSLVSADLFDGSISGKINVSPHISDGRQNVKLYAELNQIDLERSLLALLDSKRVTGQASGQIDLQAEGLSSAELISSLSGYIDIEASRMSFSGINLLNFLHRVEQRPLGAGIALKSGTTDFDTMQSTLAIQNGIGTFKTANFTRLPDLQIKLNGQIDFVSQNFAVSGHALGASATDSNQSINLPFVLKGPFSNPAFLPDFVNVSKQTGTIAP